MVRIGPGLPDYFHEKSTLVLKNNDNRDYFLNIILKRSSKLLDERGKSKICRFLFKFSSVNK